MKATASILKGLQTGGAFGVVGAIAAWSTHQFAELILLRNLGVGFAALGLAASLGLLFVKEKRRALFGGLLLILGILVAVGFAPSPIER